jgi:hypothetical protein
VLNDLRADVSKLESLDELFAGRQIVAKVLVDRLAQLPPALHVGKA